MEWCGPPPARISRGLRQGNQSCIGGPGRPEAHDSDSHVLDRRAIADPAIGPAESGVEQAKRCDGDNGYTPRATQVEVEPSHIVRHRVRAPPRGVQRLPGAIRRPGHSPPMALAFPGPRSAPGGRSPGSSTTPTVPLAWTSRPTQRILPMSAPPIDAVTAEGQRPAAQSNPRHAMREAPTPHQQDQHRPIWSRRARPSPC